uniref:NADH dehydrogenase subunit 4 n=1 Tax=Xestocephalus biprocessus TaxID=3112134 RepID=UPI002E7A7204|nr:NADH dehydrogenase subunit 4 [Xestocephalus biprocessus]WRK21292.1 NADH dehydrogenase subunit 4 [Xestocephalus biprocessus]
MMMFLYLVFSIPLFFFNFIYLGQLVYVFMIMNLLIYYSADFFSNLSYVFGMDCFSYWLILLSLVIFCLMGLSSINLLNCSFFKMMNYFLFFCLFLVFYVMNFFYMYLFFEFSLVPLLVIIFGWGYQPERLFAGYYLLFYTLFASLPLLLIIIWLYLNYGSMFFDNINDCCMSFIVHFSMVFSFLVKFPMFMFHFWLPKAHVQAPISGSMVLAGLMLKVGGYGMIRVIFLNDELFYNYSYIWYSLSIWGGIIVSVVCFYQGDIKCLIAYSSVAHMGMCILGLMSVSLIGVYGSFFLMIGHGLCSSGMFCLASMSYERLLSRSFFINKGLMVIMPGVSLMWFLFCCFNMGCPPSINFISEVFIMISMLNYYYYSCINLVFISFFSACFSYYLFSYSQHGIFHNCYTKYLMLVREYLLLFIHVVPLILIIFIINVFF